MQLRQIADEVKADFTRHPRVAQVTVLGGQRRVVNVTFDRDRLASYGVSLVQAYGALSGLNWRLPAGSFSSGNAEVPVEVGSLFRRAEDVGSAVIGVVNGKPVWLKDVATVADGPEEPAQYAWMLTKAGEDAPAVTLAVAKKPGTNAVELVKDLDVRLEGLKGPVVPSNVTVTKTRDYGKTADEKSSELIFHVGLATLSVVLLMALFLGRREAVVVLVAVPATLALTLFASYLFGYTLNRVTLFALIFAIGILVDDAIVVVENVHRHYELGWGEPRLTTVYAVDEVGNPTILATFAVVAALLPLAFVSGLMGPYMRPIPVNASAAMVFSLLVAFVVSPWLTFRLFRKFAEEHLKGEAHFKAGAETPPRTASSASTGSSSRRSSTQRAPPLGAPRRRRRPAPPLLRPLPRPRRRRSRCCPYDNKSELQVVLDMPEGTTLEATAAAARELAALVKTRPEVTDVEVYAGTSAPFNFNGLVRHYFLRSGPLVADLQVNLAPKDERSKDSHTSPRRSAT